MRTLRPTATSPTPRPRCAERDLSLTGADDQASRHDGSTPSPSYSESPGRMNMISGTTHAGDVCSR
jgi:hypothetical protein